MASKEERAAECYGEEDASAACVKPSTSDATTRAPTNTTGSVKSEASKNPRKTCVRFLVGLASVVIAAIAFVAFAMLVLNRLAMLIGEWADGASDEERTAVIVAFCVALLLSNIGPGNGQIFQILVCYLYDWWGLLMIVLARLIGLAIAFQGARTIWRRCGDRCTVYLPRIPKSMMGEKGIVAFLLAMLETIGEKPLQVLTLLLFAPVPHSVVAYIVGARADGVSLLTFSAANLISCLKLGFSMFLASQADNVAEITNGIRNRATMAVTFAGIICAFLALALMGYLANRKLQQMAEAKQHANTNTSSMPSHAGQLHSDGGGQNSDTVADVDVKATDNQL